MRQTATKLAQAYTPMIKFFGGKHPVIHQSGPVGCHPCTIDGLAPGSKECVSAGEFLSKLKPFKVTPYHNPHVTAKSGSSSAGSSSSSSSSAAKLADKIKSRYTFVNRPLKENEAGSISELPARFRFKPISEVEAEAINGGGAL